MLSPTEVILGMSEQSTLIETCRKSRCFFVMVWSAAVTHSTFRELGRKTISFSFIAFERSIEVDLLPPRKGVRPVRRQMPDGLTGDMTSNIEGLKGV